MRFNPLINLATKAGVEGKNIVLRTPLIDLTKAEIIGVGLKLGVDYAATVSCYQARRRRARMRSLRQLQTENKRLRRCTSRKILRVIAK